MCSALTCPPLLRQVVWAQRGDYLIVDPSSEAEAGGKVRPASWLLFSWPVPGRCSKAEGGAGISIMPSPRHEIAGETCALGRG